MFEDYLQDSYNFYTKAQEEVSLNNERSAKMYFRASVFCAASALESFVNFIGDTFSKGGNLDKAEIAFLNDKVLEVSSSKGKVEEKSKYSSIDNKIKFILRRFSVPFDPARETNWRSFVELKEFRDSLIHPRGQNDEVDLVTYQMKIKNGLNANIDIMDSISKAIFHRPIRRNLIDLKV